MLKLAGMILVLTSLATYAVAGFIRAPEIDGSTAGAAIALVSGGLMILRGRRKK